MHYECSSDPTCGHLIENGTRKHKKTNLRKATTKSDSWPNYNWSLEQERTVGNFNLSHNSTDSLNPQILHWIEVEKEKKEQQEQQQ